MHTCTQLADEGSELKMLWRVTSAQHTAHFLASEALPDSPPTPTNTAPATTARKEHEGAGARPHGLSLVKRLFSSATALPPRQGGEEKESKDGGGLAVAHLKQEAQLPTGAGETAAILQDLQQRAADKARRLDDGPAALLEVFVYEAANLPTDEWTRAFCVVKLTHPGGGGDPWAVNAHEDFNDAIASYEVNENGLSWQSLSGQAAHRTEVVEGIDPVFDEGFRFGVADPSVQQLRVQVLHKGFMATEFVGEILLHIEDVLHLLDQLPDYGAGGILPSQEQQGPWGGEDTHGVARAWYPLRTAAAGRVRNRLGSDSELELGFRWIEPTPTDLVEMRGNLYKRQEPASGEAGTGVDGDGKGCHGAANGSEAPGDMTGDDWQKRFFTLDPYTQVLRECIGKVGLSRINMRGVRVSRVSIAGHRAHSLRLEAAMGARAASSQEGLPCTLSAETAAECTAWIAALKSASGHREPATPPPSYRSPAVLVSALCALAVLVALAVALPLSMLLQGKATHAGPLNWTECASVGAMPACGACPCFARCIFGATLGLRRVHVSNLPHLCGLACKCQVPAPATRCGDGQRMTYEVDWYGTPVKVHEECDDGNIHDSDGCDSHCKHENFMASFLQGRRVDLPGKSLCGHGHTLGACEDACLRDPWCVSIWYGGGRCHLYSHSAPRVPALPELGRASPVFLGHWDEMEYKCGAGKFVVSGGQHQIRGSVVLFGLRHFNNHSHARILRQIFHEQPFCEKTTCTLYLLSTTAGTLPFNEVASTARRTEVSVVTVVFKLIVSNTTSASVLDRVVKYVNRGQAGLWGHMMAAQDSEGTGAGGEERPFQSLLGTMWSMDGGSENRGNPFVAPQPAPPSVDGEMLLKTKFNCTYARDVMVAPGSPPAPADVCCGTFSRVCSPMSKCYVSPSMDYKCIPKRPPFPPTHLVGLPLDGRVALSWNMPADTGGLVVDQYVVWKVKFVVGKDVVFDPLPPTGTNATRFDVLALANFVPHYFKVRICLHVNQFFWTLMSTCIFIDVCVYNFSRSPRSTAWGQAHSHSHLRA
jgi:cysteine-rich repeat protein